MGAAQLSIRCMHKRLAQSQALLHGAARHTAAQRSAPPSTREGSPPVKLANGSYSYICRKVVNHKPTQSEMSSSRPGVAAGVQALHLQAALAVAAAFHATHRCPVFQRRAPLALRGVIGADAAVKVPAVMEIKGSFQRV